jgi:hypothetical protein
MVSHFPHHDYGQHIGLGNYALNLTSLGMIIYIGQSRWPSINNRVNHSKSFKDSLRFMGIGADHSHFFSNFGGSITLNYWNDFASILLCLDTYGNQSGGSVDALHCW